MKVVWLQEASQDRDDHIAYVRAHSLRAALEQGDLIEGQIDGLAEFPEIGRPGRKAGTRELVVQGTPFIAVYRLRPRLKRVEIIRLLHGAQQWPRPELNT